MCVLLTVNSDVIKVVIVGRIQLLWENSEMLVWAGEREVGGNVEGLLSLLACLMGRGRRSPSFRVPGVRSSLNVLSLPGPGIEFSALEWHV